MKINQLSVLFHTGKLDRKQEQLFPTLIQKSINTEQTNCCMTAYENMKREKNDTEWRNSFKGF